MNATRYRRRAAVLSAATVAVTLAAAGLATPARAAALGTLTITPGNGSISANPMFTQATTSAACPATYGDNASLKIGRSGGPYNNLRATSSGDFDAAPFPLAPNRSFRTALGAAAADGNWVVVVECAGQTTGTHPERFVTAITVAGDTWQVAGAASEPVATATSLTVTPAGPVAEGTEVTLKATVTPAAAGTVTFRDGSATVATGAVADGTATAAVSSLAAGAHSLTAAFTPADAAAHRPSTSDATTLQVTARPTGVTAEQQLSAAVVSGGLTLSLAGTAVTLAGGAVGGRATGALNKATVTDARGDNSGWDLVGQVTAFTGTPNGSIPADQLGWAPTAGKVSGSGTVAAGGAAAPGSGLGTPRKLCGAGAGASAGTYECSAGLTLGIPESAAPGTYRATLTLTLS